MIERSGSKIFLGCKLIYVHKLTRCRFIVSFASFLQACAASFSLMLSLLHPSTPKHHAVYHRVSVRYRLSSSNKIKILERDPRSFFHLCECYLRAVPKKTIPSSFHTEDADFWIPSSFFCHPSDFLFDFPYHAQKPPF